MAKPPQNISPDSESPNAKPVSTHVLGDQPANRSKEDRLGFAPYVAAVADFLTNASTKTPLTMSVEGAWGAGKSSFMLQLQEALTARGKTKIVSFNAWQYESEEGLWAAFISEFDQKLHSSLGLWEKIVARWRLLQLRISWQDSIQTVKALLWLAASSFAVFSISWYLLHGGLGVLTEFLTSSGEANKSATKTIALVGGAGGAVAAILTLITQLRSLFASPASLDQAFRRFAKPNYSAKLPLIHQITQDFNRLVSAYAGDEDVYVFVDDLDRCEYSKAAELMQALLMLLSSAPKIALVVGLDRDKVAAAMAAKQEKVLPYLYKVPTNELYRLGLRYGHNFIEKFIQLSYILPVPASNGMKAMINPEGAPPPEPVYQAQSTSREIRIVTGEEDSGTLDAIIEMADLLFDHNPRNVKQFVNMFRLQAFIANATGLFRSGRVTRNGTPLTLGQLAKFVALCMRWPEFVAAAISNPSLAADAEKAVLHAPSFAGSPKTVTDWTDDHDFARLIGFRLSDPGGEYSLTAVNFSKLTEIVPSQRSQRTEPESPPIPNERVSSRYDFTKSASS